MPSNLQGLVPSYKGVIPCDECGKDALYNEYIVAEGYPDAHVEYEVICPHCGHIACSNDE